MNLTISNKYKNDLDADTLMFLHHFDEPKGSHVLEVGAYEENSSYILADNDYTVSGIDLRKRDSAQNYMHLTGDFVAAFTHSLREDCEVKLPKFDTAFSTSAIEHFGLNCYDAPIKDEDYDIKAMRGMYAMLKPGGTCYITVPFGREFSVMPDWRVYDWKTLQSRIIGRFRIKLMRLFKSGDCVGLETYKHEYCFGHQVPLVQWNRGVQFHSPTHPHLTVFLKMSKPK